MLSPFPGFSNATLVIIAFKTDCKKEHQFIYMEKIVTKGMCKQGELQGLKAKRPKRIAQTLKIGNGVFYQRVL